MKTADNPLRQFTKKTLQLIGLYTTYVEIREAIKNWRRHKILQKIRVNSILEYKQRFDPRIFIETGTYLGEMVEEMKNRFDKIYTIELGEELYIKAKEKFAQDAHITLLEGDSGVVLPQVLAEIKEPALFWLDAHYSEGTTARGVIDTPIEKELEAVLNHPVRNHVILIDDARCFLGENGYPTAQTIEKLARKHGYLFEMKDDNFRIYPKIGNKDE